MFLHPDASKAEPGLELTVDVRPEGVAVRAAAAINRAPRTGLRAPRVTEHNLIAWRPPVSELVLELVDSGGTVLEQFAWATTSVVYHDHVDPITGDLAGGAAELAVWTARWRLPIAAGTRYLVFYRTDLSGQWGMASALKRMLLGVYDLTPGEPDPPPLWPVPGPPLPPMPPVPIPRYPKAPATPPGGALTEGVPPSMSSGYVKGVTTIIHSGRVDRAFDVVIMGDGFLESELADFEARARLLAYGLVLTPPFSAFRDRINVHIVHAVSAESGVTLPPNTIRNTCFAVQGCFGRPAPTFFGTSAVERVFEAAELAVPLPHTTDVVVMLVNYASAGGGSACPEARMVFVPMIEDPDRLINTAVHEAAHVIAGLREEYLGCTPHNPLPGECNQVTQAQVDAGDIWWKKLARPEELQPDGSLRAVHVHGDPMSQDCQPLMPKALAGMLGAYWGCQDTDPPDPPPSPSHCCPETSGPMTCNSYCDARGAPFYRAMAECKMRRLRYRFCRVCQHLLSKAILTAAP